MTMKKREEGLLCNIKHMFLKQILFQLLSHL